MKIRAEVCHFLKSLNAIGLSLIVAAGAITACSQAEFTKSPDPVGGSGMTPPTPPPGGGGPGICIPGGGGTPRNGLVGRLYYLNDNQPRYQQAMQYIQHGQLVPNPLFLNHLNVPTVRFERGFVYDGGQALNRQDGQRLTSFFGMQLWSAIQLNGTNPTGNYQLAVISDDGAVFTIREGSTDSVILNNDGYNSSRLRCATRPVAFDAATKLPMRLEYFQGPPTHISLVFMWRPWPADGNWRDPLCGMQGDEFFFDYTQTPSQPTVNYNDLLSRGWRPLDPSNFVLPDGYTNPCNDD
ncbi:MAG TPA: hypothetical protein VFV50_01175 [Bdellovibrionales bacterium]|nr:hypothetical protein [Bdellovibrionales bacterium]